MATNRRARPVSKDVKRFLDADKDDTRLLGAVRQHLLKKPVGEGRAQHVIHPSEMAKANWCHRATNHRILGHQSAKPFKPSYQLLNVFEEGHLIHAKWQRWLREMGVLYGVWKCGYCSKEWEALSPTRCIACSETDYVKYREVPVVDLSRTIQGHADGLVKDSKGEVLIEIKSIGLGTIRFEEPELLNSADGDLDKLWNNIRRPLNSHVRQASVYAEILKVSHICFLYEFKPTQAVKEFYVRSSAAVTEPLFDAAERITAAVSRKELVECPYGGCSECAQYESA